MNVTILGPNLPDQRKGSFHVHTSGCADIHRNPNYRNEETDWTFECDSIEEVVTEVYMDIMAEHEEDTWEDYENDFHFCPCTRSLKRSKA
jgi:hypothetical protein